MMLVGFSPSEVLAILASSLYITTQPPVGGERQHPRRARAGAGAEEIAIIREMTWGP
jgi:hypothetical protein